MKKLFFTVLLLVGFIMSASAQFAIKPQFGLNISSSKVPDMNYQYESGIGGQAGVTLVFGNKFYFEPGLIWKNYSNKILVFEGDEGHQFQFSTLKIPVYAGLHLIGNNDKSIVDLRIFGGPSASIFLSSGDKNVLNDANKSTFFSMNAGLGVSVWFIFLDVGYEYGLTNVFEIEDDSVFPAIKTNDIFFNLGVRLRL